MKDGTCVNIYISVQCYTVHKYILIIFRKISNFWQVKVRYSDINLSEIHLIFNFRPLDLSIKDIMKIYYIHITAGPEHSARFDYRDSR